MYEISGYQQDSDSEAEEGVDGIVHKISNAFAHLYFSGSEEECSGDENGSSADQDTDGDFIEAVEPNGDAPTKKRLAELNEQREKEELDKVIEEAMEADEVDAVKEGM